MTTPSSSSILSYVSDCIVILCVSLRCDWELFENEACAIFVSPMTSREPGICRILNKYFSHGCKNELVYKWMTD